MRGLELMKLVFEIILFLMILALINTLISGCSMPLVRPSPTPIESGADVIYRTIRSTDWLASILLIGFVLSLVVSGLGFGKLGIISAGSCVAGLFLKAAISNTWFYYGAGLIVLGIGVLTLAAIIRDRKAIRELIIGAQNLKRDIPYGNEYLQNVQSKDTQKLVQETKAVLKNQGVI